MPKQITESRKNWLKTGKRSFDTLLGHGSYGEILHLIIIKFLKIDFWLLLKDLKPEHLKDLFTSQALQESQHALEKKGKPQKVCEKSVKLTKA